MMLTESIVEKSMQVIDLVPEWQRARDAYQQQIDFFRGSGLNAALPIKTLEAWRDELDHLIGFYSPRRRS
jgi:hypothetical protein